VKATALPDRRDIRDQLTGNAQIARAIQEVERAAGDSCSYSYRWEHLDDNTVVEVRCDSANEPAKVYAVDAAPEQNVLMTED
jgi:hypothetical protein